MKQDRLKAHIKNMVKRKRVQRARDVWKYGNFYRAEHDEAGPCKTWTAKRTPQELLRSLIEQG